MRVLAIETSCDETAAAVVEGAGSRRSGVGKTAVRVLSSVVASQADLHARTEGVVPEVAARAHVEAIGFVVDDALRNSGMGHGPWGMGNVPAIDAVAVTTEPGLRPALVVGETAGRALAVAWGKPFIPVNHIAGHVAAAWLPQQVTRNRELGTRDIFFTHRFPAVILVVSGGHTQLWRLSSPIAHPSSLRLLGETRDDAAGEAFDKIARLLGLPYPGGPALAKLAEQGDASAFSFPRPMIARPAKPRQRRGRSGDSGDLDFSFSGLKTAVYYTLREMREERRGMSEQQRCDIAASAQEAIVDVLVAKTVNAAAREGAAEVILTGGVAANERLRKRLAEALGPPSDSPPTIGGGRGGIPLVVPHPQFCTDNAAMIGAAAVLGLQIPPSSR